MPPYLESVFGLPALFSRNDSNFISLLLRSRISVYSQCLTHFHLVGQALTCKYAHVRGCLIAYFPLRLYLELPKRSVFMIC